MSTRNPSERSGWWADASCRGLDGNIWFPEKPQGRDYFALARKYCNLCKVREACLAEALELDADHDRFGMWGGHTPKERQRIRETGRPDRAVKVTISVRREILTPVTRKKVAKQPQFPLSTEARDPQDVIRVYEQHNQPDLGEIALKRKPTLMETTKIPKQTQLLMNVTPTLGASQVTAQAAAAMIMAGWEDPMDARTAAALFMGASYVAELARQGVERGAITPAENAAVQGVAELAMRVWKHHATNANPNT
jgi:hypothetical protein